VEGDHNSERCQFVKDSIAIFFHNTLSLGSLGEPSKIDMGLRNVYPDLSNNLDVSESNGEVPSSSNFGAAPWMRMRAPDGIPSEMQYVDLEPWDLSDELETTMQRALEESLKESYRSSTEPSAPVINLRTGRTSTGADCTDEQEKSGS